MALSADTAQAVIQALGVTSGDAATLLGKAIARGSASGNYPLHVNDGTSQGTDVRPIVSAHHAGNRKFVIEVS